MKEQLNQLKKKALADGLEFVDKAIQAAKEKNYWWDIKKYNDYPTLKYFDSGLPSFYLSDFEKTDYSKLLTNES